MKPHDRGYVAKWSLRITTAPPDSRSAPPGTGADPSTGTADGRPGSRPRPPGVTSTRPGSRATQVRRGADVVAALSEPWTRPADEGHRLPRAQGSTRQVPATVTWRPGTLRVVVDPRRRLRAHTTYEAVTPSVTDVAGNPLDQSRPGRAAAETWRFTTH